jgi:hypothetical protein
VFASRAGTGEELLDRVQDRLGVADEPEVVITRHLDEPGVGDVLGEVSPVRHVDQAVVRAMQDQRRDPDRGQDVPDVELAEHPTGLEHHAGRRAEALVPTPPSPELRIARHAGPDGLQEHAAAPPELELPLDPRLELERVPPRVVGRLRVPGRGVEEHEAVHAFGEGRREHHAHAPAATRSQQRGPG